MTALPPRAAVWLLRVLLPRRLGDEALDELAELYAVRVARAGKRAADRAYWRQLPGFVFRLRVASISGPLGERREAVTPRRWREWMSTLRKANGWRRRRMESIWRDVRLVLRGMLRKPAVPIVAVVILAVGIGATTSIYSVVDAVLLRALPYPRSERLVTVSVESKQIADLPFSDRGYFHFLRSNTTFDAFGGFRESRLAFRGSGDPIEVGVALLSRSAFNVLRVAPLLGRLPAATEDIPGGPRVALISYGFWQRWFGRDPAVIGETVQLAEESTEIIGVMPREFRFPTRETELWIPLRLDPASNNYSGHGIKALARLKDGVSVSTAVRDVEALITRFEEAGYPAEWMTGIFTGRGNVQLLKDAAIGDARRALLVAFATVGILMVVACANVASLLIVRSIGRMQDAMVRLALGASAWQTARVPLVESATVATVGGLIGLGVAGVGVHLLVSIGPESIPRLDEIRLNGKSVLFAAVLTLWIAAIAGVVPAMRAGSRDVGGALRSGGSGGTASADRQRVQNAIVIGAVGLSTVLLVLSGLMIKSVYALRSVDPGFHSAGVLSFDLEPPGRRYPDSRAAYRVYSVLLESLRRVPGVIAVGAVSHLPLTGGGARRGTAVEGFSTLPGETPPTFSWRWVTPGYFNAIGIPIVSGRPLEETDFAGGQPAVVISTSVEKQYWPGDSGLGRRVGADGSWRSIVGVAGDIHDGSLEEQSDPIIYMPMADSLGRGRRAMSVVVRTDRDPGSLVPIIKAEVRRIDEELPVGEMVTTKALLSQSMNRFSFTMMLVVIAAVISLFLGATAVYGVMSHVVSLRAREMGVRIAVGANAPDLWRHILSAGLRLTVVGISIGLIVAAMFTRLLGSLLFEVDAQDLGAFGIAAGVLALSALVACIVPAHRAAAVDPAEMLRRP